MQKINNGSFKWKPSHTLQDWQLQYQLNRLNITTVAVSFILEEARQSVRVIRVPELRSRGHWFKPHSDHKLGQGK